ncbi:hypothetical protein IFM58399_00624 [Aspergillus lentulus]|uniref:Uncharacterized protein n=1 Tax=Aspergillus lentulus TaxID=293939 RepID=A0AAN5YU47_ASPLE|nr:uncharacterized protein IFM58399_00624 [Aspergillus lentulus]KAF4157027.1 hypothetical protein CNMCM6069_006196 [Aspergillus lentulus]KAF4163862.1 hypothetical protein CNMCM6936_000213 [Aspergillus lentulus]KAF4177071.1 hypothetical protein CNMCM8060_005839 [Aspergillus lentulus]KAF4185966.1 hypothetical protein CNMCM7927_006144 [Aspergillus lentulus]KAF4194363.1 hypothetical protein CNMCM8694_007749 [Aspergillus lentulus]
MWPQFPGAPAETMGHHTEMQSTMPSLPGSPTAMEGLAPVSHQHAETALQGEQEQGSHFDNAFFDPDDISFDKVPTHVPDSFDWETFDKTYRSSHEQGANVLFERRNLIPTYNARGYGNIQRHADDHGDEAQYAEIFERAVETRNKGQVDADFWENAILSPIPPSISSVLEMSPVQHHNNTPRVQHIEQGTAHHGLGGFNAQDHEQKDDMPSYGNPSAQHHDVSVESIGVGSSNVEIHKDTDPACTGDTYDAHHDVEMIESRTSESLDAGTPVAQAYVQAVEKPAKKTTPTFAKQSDGGRRRNGNQGQSWSEPIHSDLSGEKDESSEAQSSSQKNSGDSTPPSANIEDLIDPALTASIQNNVPNSESANMTSHPAHTAEKTYGTTADSQEAQLAYPSRSQGVPTSMQDQSQQDSNGSAVLNHPTNNQAHRPPTVQQSQRRSLSSAAATNHVDQSQEHPARDISNEQQQIQPRPVNSERPAQGKATQSPHASVVSVAASNDYHSSEAPQVLSEQASSDSAADRRKKPTVVDKQFPPIDTIPGLPTSHELMNPEWSRPEIQTTGVQTSFASLEEAMSALDSPKGPGRDPHLVVGQAQKIMIVNSFLRAMMNLDGVDDKDKTTLVWKNTMRRKPVEIEAACWNVLELLIEYHRTMPLPPPKEDKKKGGNKGRKDKEEKEEEDDEEDEGEKTKVKDPAKTGALLSFPDRVAAIVRIFYTNKSTCKRMLDYHGKYIREFVDTPLECLVRCRANIIVNENKGGHIKTGRAVEAAAMTEGDGKKNATGKAKGKAKGKAEAEAEAEPPVGGGSADEAHEVEDAEKAGNDSQESVAIQDQDTSGQRGPSYASAAHGQSSYGHNGQYSQGYSMQGQNNTGYHRVMSNAGHNQGMNNNRHVPGMTYTGQYQGVTNTGHIQGMTYTGYNNINPGVSNTGQIQRTINTGQLPPTNTSGLHPSMVPMDQALNAARHAYGSHSEYDQHSISPDFSATAGLASDASISHASSMDPYLWAANMSCEMPPPPQLPPQMPTYYRPTLTPTSMVDPNPVVSASMGLNPGLPPNNQTRGRKRGSAETGADENGPPTKRHR